MTNALIMKLLFSSELVVNGKALTFHQLAAVPTIEWTAENREVYAKHLLYWIDRLHDQHSTAELHNSIGASLRKFLLQLGVFNPMFNFLLKTFYSC
jgi:hypothetical protein